METLHRSSTSLSYFPNACLTTLSASVTADDMSIASFIFSIPRNSKKYVAYTFPIADAREKDLIRTLPTFLPNKFIPLDALLVALRVRPNPVERFAKASVIRMMFPLTFGALERVTNNSFRFFASRGMLFTALPDATLPSFPMAATICERLIISKLNEPI